MFYIYTLQGSSSLYVVKYFCDQILIARLCMLYIQTKICISIEFKLTVYFVFFLLLIFFFFLSFFFFFLSSSTKQK